MPFFSSAKRGTKRRRTRSLAAALALMTATTLGAAFAPRGNAAGMTADQVVRKVVEAYQKMDSYKMIDFKYGYDTFTKDREEKVRQNYKDVAKNEGLSVDQKSSKKPQLKQGTYQVLFKKPYRLRMIIVKSDFVPDFLNEAVLTYDTAKSAKRWEGKLKSVPLALRRSVANDDSGGFLEMGYAFAIAQMMSLKSNGTAKLLPNEKVLGADCYVLEISFKPQQWNKFSPARPDMKKFGIPAELGKMLDSTLSDPKKQKFSSVKFWVDSKKFIIVKREEYINGKFNWKTEYRNVEINKLTDADFK